MSLCSANSTHIPIAVDDPNLSDLDEDGCSLGSTALPASIKESKLAKKDKNDEMAGQRVKVIPSGSASRAQSFVIREVEDESDDEVFHHRKRRGRQSWFDQNYARLVWMLISAILGIIVYLMDSHDGRYDIGLLEVPLFIWIASPCVLFSILFFVQAIMTYLVPKTVMWLTQTFTRHAGQVSHIIIERLFYIILCKIFSIAGVHSVYSQIVNHIPLVILFQVVLLDFFVLQGFRSMPGDIFVTRPIKHLRTACISVYVVLIMSLLKAISLRLIHDSLSRYVFRDEIPGLLLQRDVLEMLCASEEAERDRMQSEWATQKNRYSVTATVDRIRSQPLKLPLQPCSGIGSSASGRTEWAFAENAFVEVQWMAQMRTIAVAISDNVFSLKGVGEEGLTFERWRAFFENDEDAHDAFDLLFDELPAIDRAAISPAKFRLALYSCFKRRQLVQAKIANYDSLFEVVSVIVNAFFCLFMCLLVGSLFQQNLNTFMATLMGVFASVSFAIRSTIKRVFESILFIFCTQPYQVGDRVRIDGVDYRVLSIHLLSTDFLSSSKMHMTMSNADLVSQPIHNYRRSGNAVVDFRILVGASTSMEKINQLKDRIKLYLHDYVDIWKQTVQLRLYSVDENTSLGMHIRLEHILTWQEKSAISTHTSDLIDFIRHSMVKLEIAAGDPALWQYV